MGNSATHYFPGTFLDFVLEHTGTENQGMFHILHLIRFYFIIFAYKERVYLSLLKKLKKVW